MSGVKQLESILEEYLQKKAPALPKNIKDLIVNLAPYANLVLILMGLPALLAVFGISAFMARPLAYWGGVRLGLTYYLSLIFLGVTVGIRLLALPGLFARKQAGWRWMYWSMLLSLVYYIFSYNLFSGLIGTVIGLYFLFQVKAEYK